MHTKSHKTNLIIAISILIISAIIYNICKIPLITHAEEERLTGSQSVSVTASPDRNLSIDISSANVGLDFTPNAAGVFKSSAAPLTITVSTNNPTGYNLNMTTTTTNLTRTASLSGQTPVIKTLSSSGSFTADTFETNAWGFSLDGTNYQAVAPSRQINQTTKESNNSATNITFGVKLNNEIPSGDYKATLTFIATTNPLEASFDTAFDAAGKTQVSYNGQNYYKMQDMSGFICSMVATPTDTTALTTQSIQLIDTRDNSVYWVSKLLDGNCWMTQNLDLNLDSSVALTSIDTDLHSVTSWTPTNSTVDSTDYGSITTCSSISDAGTGCRGQTNQNFATSWAQSNDVPSSANPGYRYMIPKFLDEPNPTGQWYANGDTFANCSTQDTNCGGQGHYMIGNYYNFASANATNSVAGTVGHTVTNSDADYVMPNSICPKGWRMPLGQSSNNDLATLMTAYNLYGTNAMAFNYQGLNAVRRSPLYFVRSGHVDGGTLYYAGTDSYVWSSTISAEAYGRDLYFDGTNIESARSNSRFDGFAVRCLARTDLTIADATYLQDVTPEMRQNTAEGTEATLLDKRDGNDYTVKKINGDIWMTQNLRFTGTTLTPADSNVTSDTNMTYYSLASSDSSYANHCDSTNGYNYACIKDSGSTETGVWYNYAATSAGTITGSSNTTSATSSLCPSGWHLPTGAAAATSSEFYKLFQSISGNWIATNSYLTAFNTVPGGYYNLGSLSRPEYGLWWSATADNATNRYDLLYDSSNTQFTSSSGNRYSGIFVRCIAD